jgi:hypothetical protein
MKFLKRYKFFIAWVAYCTFMIWYFNPRQKEFYFSSDHNDFSNASNRLLLILEGAALFFLLVWLSLTDKDPGVLKRVGNVLQSGIVMAVALSLFFMFFHSDVASIGLYINRQFSRGNVQRTYIAGYFDGDETKASNLMLESIASRDHQRNDTLTRSAYRIRPHSGDTVEVGLRKGLFGFAYIDSLTFRKKPVSR